jgi:hypothetical protein
MDRLRLVSLLAPIAIALFTGCKDEPSPSPTPEEQFAAGCAAPSNGMEVTCVNICEKVARCSVGLCADQTGEATFCEPETFTALHASCMAGCTDEALAPQAAIHECTLAASCEDAFVGKTCTPDVSLVCTAPSGTDTDTESSSESGSSSDSGYDYTSSTTTYGYDSSSTSDGSSSTGGTTEDFTSSGGSGDASTSEASTSS